MLIFNLADLSRPSDALVDRRLRMASSSPDVKALFNNSPSYIYNLENEDTLQNQSPYDHGMPNDYWTPLPHIVSCPSMLVFMFANATTGKRHSSCPKSPSRRCFQKRLRLPFGGEDQREALKTTFIDKPRTVPRSHVFAISDHRSLFPTPGFPDKLHSRRGWPL